MGSRSHDFDDELKTSFLISSSDARSKTVNLDLISGFCTCGIFCTLSGNLERIVSIISTAETYDSPQLSCSFFCKILNHFKFRIRMKIQSQYALITNFIRMILLYIKQHFNCRLEMSYSKQECKLFKNRLCVL